MTTTFASLGLPRSLVDTLDRSGITVPFPIQAATVPDGLAGRDVAAEAPTGSGKTLAYALPLAARVERADRRKPRALVLAPTRELAEQIKAEIRPLARAVDRSVLAVYGGVGYGPQKAALSRGVDVLVATPGRLEDLLDQRTLDLGSVDIVVVDEADRMADMGFLPAVRRILDETSWQRQTLLFSATLDGDVGVLIRTYQSDPVRHTAGLGDAEKIDAVHHFWLVEPHDRVRRTAEVIRATGRSIVFTRTRHGATRVAKQLSRRGIGAVPIHGGRSQSQRHRALADFSSGRAASLVATDVAARGIHVDGVSSVVHFDLPTDHKDYIHRSGRTARAGASGIVVSMVAGAQQRTVRKMQQRLSLRAPIEPPRGDWLTRGGHRPAAEDVGRDEPGRSVDETGGGSTRTLHVTNLPYAATSGDLQALFSGHGTVLTTTIITDRRSGRSRGFGFVEMADQDAEKARAALDGASLGGRRLAVSRARPRRGG
jgi:superfamily II DNA/RNA helicase